MTSKTRYYLLDELRGFAVLCMVIFHGIFLYNLMFGDVISGRLYRFFSPAEPFFAAFFIFLSGLCCVLSHSNLKRGLKLAAVALLITGATIAAGEFGLNIAVYFGIIHLLAFCALFCGLLYKPLSKIPPIFAMLLFLLLFFIFYPVEHGSLWLFVGYCRLPSAFYSTPFLFWLGFPNRRFYSGDYFPVLPWLFMYLVGFFAGMFFKRHGFPGWFKARLVPFFGFMGRNALIIYILHQPIFYSAFILLSKTGLKR